MTAPMRPEGPQMNPVERFVGRPFPTYDALQRVVVDDPYVTENDIRYEVRVDRAGWYADLREHIGDIVVAPLVIIAGESLPNSDMIRCAASEDGASMNEVDLAVTHAWRTWRRSFLRADGIRGRFRDSQDGRHARQMEFMTRNKEQ